MPVIKLENITWNNHPEGVTLPSEAIIEISQADYAESFSSSLFRNVLEEYANVPVESFSMEVIMKNGPVLKYRKQRQNELVFSGPLWQ
ncbi:MAG: hypothetical protein EBR94_01085 [Bacteroidetes bacterium]|nr:hypothetical protein [Bacteroidota bacterium]